MKTQTSKSQIYCPMAAIRYARVLYEVGVPKEAVQKTREIFEEVPQLHEIFANPTIELQKKMNVVDRVFPKEIRNFLKVACRYHLILTYICYQNSFMVSSVTYRTYHFPHTQRVCGRMKFRTDYFFLLSEFEVFGSISYGNTNEKNKQAQYAYYSAGNSKIKYKHNGTSTAARWWLRSPRASSSYSFVSVKPDGPGSS